MIISSPSRRIAGRVRRSRCIGEDHSLRFSAERGAIRDMQTLIDQKMRMPFENSFNFHLMSSRILTGGPAPKDSAGSHRLFWPPNCHWLAAKVSNAFVRANRLKSWIGIRSARLPGANCATHQQTIMMHIKPNIKAN